MSRQNEGSRINESTTDRPVSLFEAQSSTSIVSPTTKPSLPNTVTSGAMMRTISYSSHFLPSYSAKVRSVIDSAESKALFSSHEKLLNWKMEKEKPLSSPSGNDLGINKINNLQSGLRKIMSTSVGIPSPIDVVDNASSQGDISEHGSGSIYEMPSFQEDDRPVIESENLGEISSVADSVTDSKSCNLQVSTNSRDLKLKNIDQALDDFDTIRQNDDILRSSTSPVNVDEMLDWNDEDGEDQFLSFDSSGDLEKMQSNLIAADAGKHYNLPNEAIKVHNTPENETVSHRGPMSTENQRVSYDNARATKNQNYISKPHCQDNGSKVQEITRKQLLSAFKCIEATAGIVGAAQDMEQNVWQNKISIDEKKDQGCPKESEKDRVTSILQSAIIEKSNSMIQSFLNQTDSPNHKSSTSSSISNGGVSRPFDDWSRRTSASVSSTLSGRDNLYRGNNVDIDLLDLYCDDELHPSLENDPNMQLFIAHTPSPQEDCDDCNNDLSRPFLTDRGTYFLRHLIFLTSDK